MGRSELQNLGGFGAIDDFFCETAELVERKGARGGTGIGEADFDFVRGCLQRGFRRCEEGIPIGASFGRRGIGGGDKAAASDVALNQAGLFEERVSGGNGGAVQAELGGQFAGGGQAFAAREGAGLDEIGDSVRDLFIDRSSGSGI